MLFGADSLQKGLFNVLAHSNPEKSRFHGYIFCPMGGQLMFSPLHLCRLLSISGVLGSLGLQQGSEVLVPKVCVSRWFQPVAFICCHFSSSGSCWRAGLSSAFPLVSP